MRGKIKIQIKNRHITFNFTLERNVTILTGDSGTGKTKLINMVRNYSELGEQSGVILKCSKPCLVLSNANWETILENTHESIVFVEESTQFLSSYEFAKAIQGSDNYYVLVTREPLAQIPYSIDAIRKIHKNGAKPKFEKIYKNISKKDISAFPYDIVIVEDSSVIDAVYILASYTYGPILGLFAFGIFMKQQVRDKYIPLVAIASPVLCFILQKNSEAWFGGYQFSYELLIFNALFTFIGLCLLIKKDKKNN